MTGTEDGGSADFAVIYGLISITVISILSLSGLVLVPLFRNPKVDTQVWMKFFIAIAVATLCGDALLHLIPQALGVGHGGDGDGHGAAAAVNATGLSTTTIDPEVAEELEELEEKWEGRYIVLKMTVTLATVFFCYFCENIAPKIIDRSGKVDAAQTRDSYHGHSHNAPQSTTTAQVYPLSDVPNNQQSHIHKDLEAGEKPKLEDLILDGPETKLQMEPYVCCGLKMIGLMIILGDAIHNFADGMAIGATYAKSASAGLSTTIAVCCHELPHELGDFVIMLETGHSVMLSLVMNLISSLTAYAGLFCGIYAAQVRGLAPWVFAGAAGVFLYVSWIDMLHHLSEKNEKDYRAQLKSIGLQMSGFAIGFTIIFLLGWFETDLFGEH